MNKLSNRVSVIIALTLCSLLFVWLAQQLFHSIWGENGRLSEYGGLVLALLLNLYTSIIISFITTGRFLPIINNSSNSPSENISENGRGVEPLVGLIIVSFIWIFINLVAQLFIGIIHIYLFDKSLLGINISGTDASRIETSISGIIYMAIVFPLMSSTSFLCGLASKTRLLFKAGWLPSVIFVSVFFCTNIVTKWISTKHLPIMDFMEEGFNISPQSLTFGGVLLMWIITAVIAFAVIFCLCLNFYIWSNLGRLFKRLV